MKYLAFIIIILSSCTKNDVSIPSSEKLKLLQNETVAWKKETLEKYAYDDTRIKGILKDIKLESLKETKTKKNEKAVIIKVGSGEYKLKYGITQTKYLVNYYDDKNNIAKSIIVDVFLDAENHKTSKLDKLVEDYIRGNKTEIEARLHIRSFYSNSIEKFLSIEKDGTITSNVFSPKYGRGNKNTSNETASSTNSGCIDWYIVTTYTYPDGTQYTTEEYIGTTCDQYNTPHFRDQKGSLLS